MDEFQAILAKNRKPNKMTLTQVLTFKAKVEAAQKLVNELHFEVCNLMFEVKHPDDQKAIMDYAKRITEVGSTTLYCPFTDTQSEWMGGPTSGPGSENTKTYLRRHSSLGGGHFSAQEVEDAKRQGLLKGGPDLTGPK